MLRDVIHYLSFFNISTIESMKAKSDKDNPLQCCSYDRRRPILYSPLSKCKSLPKSSSRKIAIKKYLEPRKFMEG